MAQLAQAEQARQDANAKKAAQAVQELKAFLEDPQEEEEEHALQPQDAPRQDGLQPLKDAPEENTSLALVAETATDVGAPPPEEPKETPVGQDEASTVDRYEIYGFRNPDLNGIYQRSRADLICHKPTWWKGSKGSDESHFMYFCGEKERWHICPQFVGAGPKLEDLFGVTERGGPFHRAFRMARLLLAWPLAASAASCSEALLAAAERGDLQQLALSLQQELVSCGVGEDGETPLHVAALNGQQAAAVHLLDAGALQPRDDMGRAPLHFAAQKGHRATAQLLLDRSAYLELEDATLRTPLHHAARGGHLAVVELLLGKGARLDARDGDQRTPLHHTARSDLLFNVTMLLLDQGSDLELEDAVGFRPLHYACNFGQSLTAMKLMDLSADVWAMDKSGWSPIIHAAAQDDQRFIQQLVERISAPREFAQPDPARFIELGDGTIGGVPSWLLIGLACLLLSVAVVVPGSRIIRRFQRVNQAYEVDQSDEELDEFISELLTEISAREGELQRMAEAWERVNISAINDLHRVKNKGMCLAFSTEDPMIWKEFWHDDWVESDLHIGCDMGDGTFSPDKESMPHHIKVRSLPRRALAASSASGASPGTPGMPGPPGMPGTPLPAPGTPIPMTMGTVAQSAETALVQATVHRNPQEQGALDLEPTSE
ncbi:unnamed protein product, partial [Effrenium voratum]